MSTEHELEELPEAEIKETFWFREYWFEGKCFERHLFLYVWYREAHTALFYRFWKRYVTYPFAKWLIKDWGDHCPYCKHLIAVAKWEKAFPEVNIKVVKDE